MVTHGTAYRYKKGCRCVECTEAKAIEYAKHYKPKKRTNGRVAATEKYDFTFAKSLLEDGASYREVSYTTGIPRTTLTDNLPGYGWTAKQGRDMYRLNKRYLDTFDSVLYDPKRRK